MSNGASTQTHLDPDAAVSASWNDAVTYIPAENSSHIEPNTNLQDTINGHLGDFNNGSLDGSMGHLEDSEAWTDEYMDGWVYSDHATLHSDTSSLILVQMKFSESGSGSCTEQIKERSFECTTSKQVKLAARTSSQLSVVNFLSLSPTLLTEEMLLSLHCLPDTAENSGITAVEKGHIEFFREQNTLSFIAAFAHLFGTYTDGISPI